MNPIITGNFQQQRHADQALFDLGAAGFKPAAMSHFLIGAPLDVARPVDRDQQESPGTDPAFAGALSALRYAEDLDLRDELAEFETDDLPRKPGLLVAVTVPEPARMNEAIRILRANGGTDVDVSRGTVIDGRWTDFDPAEPLNLVVA